MDYLNVAKTALLYLWYLVYPVVLLVTALLNVLLLALAPALHLGGYAIHACLVPFRVLAKFETLYIFVGVAAVVGILTGSLLRLSSSILVSALNLQSSPEDDEHELNHGKQLLRDVARRRGQRIKSAGRTTRGSEGSRREDKSYADLMDADRARGRGGLLSQTILEEEDDSTEGF